MFLSDILTAVVVFAVLCSYYYIGFTQMRKPEKVWDKIDKWMFYIGGVFVAFLIGLFLYSLKVNL